jgi:hypothetical protein
MSVRVHGFDALRALGRSCPPLTVRVQGVPHRCRRVFKHDFFAATSLYEGDGLYEGDSRLAVVKIGRRADCLGLPMAWLGRLATAHETRMYARLGSLEQIPAFLERIGPDMFAHVFVPGHTLQKGEQVGDDFFPSLAALLDEVHRRDMAYVDLEKRENILVGDDGRPYLIDFQISMHVGPGWGPLGGGARWVLRRFQQSDRYHLLKHWRRHRPDQLTDEQIAQSRRRSIWIQLHRWLTGPLARIRRRTLQRVAKRVPTDPLAAPGDRS